MFIKKIKIEGYRSCLETIFELNPHLSILIGPNASGKTNILCAMQLLKKLARERHYQPYREEEPTGQCSLKVWFDLNGKNVILSSAIKIYTDEDNDDFIFSSDQHWYLKDFTGTAKRYAFPLSYVLEGYGSRRNLFYHDFKHRGLKRVYRHSNAPDMRLIKILSPIAKFLSEMQYYTASQFTNPADCPVSFEIEKEGERSRGLRLSGHSKFLFDLYTEYKSTESLKYSQFLDIIGPKGIKLIDKIKFKEILTSSVDISVRSGGRIRKKKLNKILVIPQFKIGKHELSPNQLSEGTFKTITLLFYLVTESSNILLIEEPEVCVHHGLLSSIIELIKIYSSGKQIVVSTHSDFILDKIKPENVYKVIKQPDKGTQVTHISKSMSRKEFNALKVFLEREGNLGEYWKHGGLG
jgi:AAA15 family ATPase/GTPase